MRFPEGKIKEAILHPDIEIRDRAVHYFAKSNSHDPSIMGIVIKAVETYGRRDSYRLVGPARDLPQTEETIAWVIDALGQSYPDALQALEAGDYITTQSYQFTADIAALGPYGRGYRRVKLIFDTSSGAPQIVYRQDLTQLGWALGKEVRQNWVVAKATP